MRRVISKIKRERERERKMRNIILAVIVICCGECMGDWMGPMSMVQDSRVEFVGRHLVNEDAIAFDYVASGLRFSNVNGNFSLSLDAGCDKVRFGVFSGEEESFSYEFKGMGEGNNRSYEISKTEDSIVTIRKITEPFGHDCGPVMLYGANIAFNTDNSSTTFKSKEYFIDFYGDSDTAAFGVDGKKSEPFRCLEHMSTYEDFSDGWVKGLFDRLNHSFDYSIQAVSGIGVVKNAVTFGTPTLSEDTMPKIYRRSLQTVDRDDFKPSRTEADLIVIYLGGNDYTNLFWNPSAETFTNTYETMVKDIRAQYENPDITVLHICGGETKPCDYIKNVSSRVGNSFYTDTFDLGIPKVGCIGHRDKTQQATLADKLVPVFKNILSI